MNGIKINAWTTQKQCHLTDMELINDYMYKITVVQTEIVHNMSYI